MYLIYNKGLNKDILNAIKNREYSHAQLISIYQEIYHSKSNKNKGMRNAMVAFAICVVFILCASMMKNSSSKMPFLMLITFVIVFFIVFAYIKINLVNKSKRQFMNALQKGYPELIDEFTSI